MWTVVRQKPILGARCFSAAGNVVRNSVHLSPEKMRALITMYHQAETFVTRENLDAKIDEAFTGPANDHKLLVHRTSMSLQDLESVLRRRRDAPVVTEWNVQAVFDKAAVMQGADSSLWSAPSATVRERKVMEALYGVESLGGKALPGLEVLNDNTPVFEASEREEQAKYRDSDF
jgi:hypothetical protein